MCVGGGDDARTCFLHPSTVAVFQGSDTDEDASSAAETGFSSADSIKRLRFRIQVLEGELSEARLEAQRAKSEAASERTGNEIAMAELR